MAYSNHVNHHRGLVLLTSLALLLLLSILASASSSLVNLNGLLANHQQSASQIQQFGQNKRHEILAAVQTMVAQNGEINLGELQAIASDPEGAMVGELLSLHCVAETRLQGCSMDAVGQCASRYYWQLSLGATDTRLQTQSKITQGFSFDYLPGYCPQPKTKLPGGRP